METRKAGERKVDERCVIVFRLLKGKVNVPGYCRHVIDHSYGNM